MPFQKQSRNFFNLFIHSRLYLVGGAFLALFMGAAVFRQFFTKHQVDAEINQLKAEIKNLESGNQELSQLLEYFNSEEFLKQEAKLKFGLKEQGEQVVVLTDRTQNQRKMLAAVEQEEVVLTNPQKWWQYIFNHN